MALRKQCIYSAGMPVAVTIRNVPDEVRAELAARAARSGRSLQEYLLAELTELAAKPSFEETIGRIRRRVDATGRSLDADVIVDAVRAGRDRRR